MKINQRGLIAFAVIVVLKVVIRVFGALGFYTIPTPAMEPTIKTGQYILTTKLFGYNRGDGIL